MSGYRIKMRTEKMLRSSTVTVKSCLSTNLHLQ